MWRNCGILLLVCAALINSYLVYRDDLQVNETPKALSVFSNACAECQIVVRRLADVAKDPGKMAEVKAILLVLCDETSYKEECRMFINRLDLFLDKLLPYLRNPHEVCRRLHICANKKLQSMHDIGEFFAKDRIGNNAIAANTLLCDECQFAVDELKAVIDDVRYETEVKEFLSHEVCAHMGRFQGICDSMLEDFLPDFWQELRDILKDSNKFCMDLKLCKSKSNIISATVEPRDSVEKQPQRGRISKVSKTLVSTLLNY